MRGIMEKIMKMDPCYSKKKTEEIFAVRKWLTPITIAKLDIPLNDRLWVLIGLLSQQQQREFSRRCALDVIHLCVAPPVVKKYLKTGDETIREAAWLAVNSNICSFVCDFAFSAACTRDPEITRDAAYHTAWEAAREGVWDTAKYTTYEENCEKYISWCVEYLDGTKETTCE
jgi:hypothetical protein